MQVEELLPGIYRIPVALEGSPLRVLNSYVICGDLKGNGTRNLLVDTGFRTDACKKAIRDGLDAIGISMEDTDILLTHFHVDHSGNASDLICDGNKIYIGENDRKYLVAFPGEENSKYAADGLLRFRAERFMQHGISEEMIADMTKSVPSKKMAIDPGFLRYTTLKDGERIQAGPYKLHAIETPGHTRGHMCYEIEGTGAMILGDHVLFDITPNITDWPDTEDSLGDYLNSLDKISRYDVTLPLPAHRETGDFYARVAKIREHHERRLDECCRVIRELGKAKLYDITGRMKWRIRTDSWDTFPSAQRWFALGECLSHIDYLVNRGVIRRCEEDGLIWYENI